MLPVVTAVTAVWNRELSHGFARGVWARALTLDRRRKTGLKDLGPLAAKFMHTRSSRHTRAPRRQPGLPRWTALRCDGSPGTLLTAWQVLSVV